MNRQRPRLKNGVDLQVQTAFSDGNWPTVVRLAEKRARTMNDQYYEILKICAESQLDDTTARLAAAGAVWQFAKDGTVIQDVDAIDLLEWASLDLIHEDDFCETLGPLRVRTVKASPKDKLSAFRCLESCLIHWDLNSAQQIAAILDRSFPQERRYLFWNIVITHLLAESPQSPSEKKKLYGTLAQKQIERAAQASEQSENLTGDASAKPPARAIHTEEEILLLYAIVEAHGSPDDFTKLMSSKLFSPLKQFQNGRKELFMRVVSKYRKDENWQSIFQLCKDCLVDQDESGSPNFLASDWSVWEVFILAAEQIKVADESATGQVQSLLMKFAQSKGLRTIYRRNIMLARVSAAFRLSYSEEPDSSSGKPTTIRLQELLHYVEDQASSPACLDDIRSFLEELDFSGINHLAYEFLPHLAERTADERKRQRVKLLALKMQYFAATSPRSYNTVAQQRAGYKCAVCGGVSDYQSCLHCFEDISKRALETYELLKNDQENNSEVLSELAVLFAFCSSKLACPDPRAALSGLSASSLRYLFHAILVLETQLSFTPKNGQFLLLLVQFHLLVGSAPRARMLWEELGVKRTIMDSLAPIFYDRLSIVAPAMISPLDNWGYHLMDMLTTHFNVSLKLRMPHRLVDAFEAESYSSILTIPEYINDLRRSSTRVMSLVEEARSERSLDNASWELLLDPRFTEVTDDLLLKTPIDYGSFPVLDHSACLPIYARLRIGPPPTSRRAHLSLLAEAFHDILGYKPPQMYKVPIAATASDQTFALESLCRLSNSLAKYIDRADSDLTRPERVYYHTISVLGNLVLLCAEGRPTDLDEHCIQLSKALEIALDSLRSQIPPSTGHDTEDPVTLLSSMHVFAVYRETANAIRLGSEWILTYTDQDKEWNRGKGKILGKQASEQLKLSINMAQKALKDGKEQVAGLKNTMSSQGGFQSRFAKWLFEDVPGVKSAVADAAVVDLAAYLGENVNAWQQIKWE